MKESYILLKQPMTNHNIHTIIKSVMVPSYGTLQEAEYINIRRVSLQDKDARSPFAMVSDV
jgi:hypothetical protein